MDGMEGVLALCAYFRPSFFFFFSFNSLLYLKVP